MLPFGEHQFVKHKEQPVRLDRSGCEIVVAVFRVVEVEPAQFPGPEEARDHQLDVGVRQMMSEVDEALGSVT